MLVAVPHLTLGPLLGTGGMGRVYAAADARGNRVAVKLLKPDLAADPRMVARFEAEARSARRVSHPNVVRVLDHRATDGVPYLVMELASGHSLTRLIRARGTLSLAAIRSIAHQLLAGLAAIHRAGLVHGDVKSDNILVDDAGHVTIIDLGLARPPATDAVLGAPATVCGTLEYIAPELLRGEPCTPAADLYSVAIVLYEMLIGSTPFAGWPAADVHDRQLHARPLRPGLCCARRIPARFERLLLCMLDKSPARRYQSAAELAVAFEAALPREDHDHDHGGEPFERGDSTDTLDGVPLPGSPTQPELRRLLARGTEPTS